MKWNPKSAVLQSRSKKNPVFSQVAYCRYHSLDHPTPRELIVELFQASGHESEMEHHIVPQRSERGAPFLWEGTQKYYIPDTLLEAAETLEYFDQSQYQAFLLRL